MITNPHVTHCKEHLQLPATLVQFRPPFWSYACLFFVSRALPGKIHTLKKIKTQYNSSLFKSQYIMQNNLLLKICLMQFDAEKVYM